MVKQMVRSMDIVPSRILTARQFPVTPPLSIVHTDELSIYGYGCVFEKAPFFFGCFHNFAASFPPLLDIL